jgi:hypothetical protein
MGEADQAAARRTSRQERVMARLGDIQVGGRKAPAMTSEFAEMLRLFKSLFDTYHPERHYMRGPGPKWHAKHGRPAAEPHPAPGLFHAGA